MYSSRIVTVRFEVHTSRDLAELREEMCKALVEAYEWVIDVEDVHKWVVEEAKDRTNDDPIL